MTDNFSLFKEYIIRQEIENTDKVFETFSEYGKLFDNDEDRYYVIEIMRRGKDNPNLSATNVHFKNYYINKISDLDKYKDEIIKLCEMFNMRAYVSVNYKRYKQVMLDTAAEITRRIAVHNYKKPQAIFESCSGKYCDSGNKVWIIDVDKEDADKYGCTVEFLTISYGATIENVCEPYEKPIMIIPTRSGCHIICHPFNVDKFNKRLVSMNLDPHSEQSHQIIKKNHVTLLYENIK